MPFDLETQHRILRRLIRVRDAEDDLLTYLQLSMPTVQDPDDADKSLYEIGAHHRVIASAMHAVDRGEITKLLLVMPPRHGKTQTVTKGTTAWYSGRHPEKSVIVGTYNGDFAADLGRDVRALVQSAAHKQVFPDYALEHGSEAADRLKTTRGGLVAFVGRGTAITGRGGDLLVLDDPLKDDKEAQSPTIRDQLWHWFTRTFLTRRMTDKAAVIVIQCMTGDTPVLMGDGTEKRLEDVRPGDRVATYRRGRLATAEVLAWSKQGPDRVFKLTTRSGRAVRANARHPFLVENNGVLEWRQMGSLRPGENILRVITESGRGLSARPPAAGSRQSAGGFAQATTARTGGRAASGRRLPTRRRAVRRICGIVTAWSRWTTRRCSRVKAAFVQFAERLQTTLQRIGARNYAWTTTTTAGASALCCATTATMSSESVIHRNFWSGRPNISDFTPDSILEIVDDGVADVYDITVEETENFIANGLVSHNTRWHEDDLIGRLTDPKNPHFSMKLARDWKIIDLPALAVERKDRRTGYVLKDPLGRAEGEPLWPERFSKPYLEEMREADPVGFQALYQGNPRPEQGVFFKKEQLVEYGPDDLPPRDALRFYMAADFAVSTQQINDRTWQLIAGLDERGVLWIMPDAVYGRMQSDMAIERAMGLIQQYRPLLWWVETGQINKALGPHLRKRMAETKNFATVAPIPHTADKMTKAQSIHGRMSQGLVRFPARAPWWGEAAEELLSFPRATHDDFVDTLALFGQGLDYMTTANAAPTSTRSAAPRPGTYGEMIAASNRARAERLRATTRYW